MDTQEFIHAIERDEVGFSRDEPFEPSLELDGALALRVVFMELEIAIEPPDQFSRDVERPSLVVVEAIEFMHQTLGVDPTQSVVSEAKLAGNVGDDHGVLKETVGAPQSAPSVAILTAERRAIAELANQKPRFFDHGRRTVVGGGLLPRQITKLSGAIGTLELVAGRHSKARDFFRQSVIDPTGSALAQAEWASPAFGVELVTANRLAMAAEAEEATAFLHCLLNLRSQQEIRAHSSFGHSWEGFCIENLLAAAGPAVRPFFYRADDQDEVDLVLEFSSSVLWAIEIKGPNTKTGKGLIRASEVMKAARRLVVGRVPESFDRGGHRNLTLRDAMAAVRPQIRQITWASVHLVAETGHSCVDHQSKAAQEKQPSKELYCYRCAFL